MEQSQESKNTSLPKQFDKLTVEQKSQVKNQTVNRSDKIKNLSLKQRHQLGITYLA
jgi:hypothetical protein